MEQLKRRRQKLVAALMAATTLSGGKTAPPAAAMSQGLNKATTKAATNKKSGLPTWAKWLIAGGASLVGAAGIGGLIWWCLKDKNKDPKDPNETNKDSDGLNGQKNIDNKAKISVKNGERLNFIKLSDLSEIKEDENEDKDTSIISDNDEGKIEGKDKNVINKQTLIEKENQEESPIINNANEAKENEKKQKEAEAEEKAKREAEKQENVSAFCEKVKEFEPLSKAMDSVINWENYNKKDAIDRNNGFNATYRPLQDNIEDYGKTVRIKNVGKCQNQQLKNLIKNKVGNDIDKDFHYVITLNGNSWNVVLFGDDKVAIYELNDIFYFYKYQAKN